MVMAPIALAVDTSNWYQYNGETLNHSYSIKYPVGWKAVVSSSGEQVGFSPSSVYGKLNFIIEELESQTYDQAIKSETSGTINLVSVEDFIFSGRTDLVGKRATFKDSSTQKETAKTFIKRGNVIISLTDPSKEGSYKSEIEGIYSSFGFTDNWHQYIDFEDQYTFIFPAVLEINNVDAGVSLWDPEHFNSGIFEIFKINNTTVENAAQLAIRNDESLVSTDEVFLPGAENSIRAVYKDGKSTKTFSKILAENNGDSFSLTDTNLESNYPHMNYYDSYILEMLQSFEFFNVEGEYTSYEHFPDVREDHNNEEAINYLTAVGTINGYPDGTFKPNGAINRAELTKMIVATKKSPDQAKYKDCFDDVATEWFAPYVCYAKAQEWVEGYDDGTFKPEKNVNRAEALKIILGVLVGEIKMEVLKDKTILDVDSEAWYAKFYNYADNHDLLDRDHIVLKEDGYNYLPAEAISRKEVAETIYRTLEK